MRTLTIKNTGKVRVFFGIEESGVRKIDFSLGPNDIANIPKNPSQLCWTEEGKGELEVTEEDI